MAKRLSKVKIKWCINFAYAVGLIASDGNLSTDGRHISFTSKDKSLATLFKKCLGLENKIGKKSRGYSKEKKYYVVQFGDVNLYKYLLTIGLTPAKSKTISKISVPQKYFVDFLRGCLDGDGNISVFNHPESKQKQLKVRFASASKKFVIWIYQTLYDKYNIPGGHIYNDKIKSIYTLSYAKTDGGKILKLMYHRNNLPFLKRKKDIFDSMLGEW